jgi:hypothetical protein
LRTRLLCIPSLIFTLFAAGNAGKSIQLNYHGLVGRISGLDPAGPSFSRYSISTLNDEKLRRGDAFYVDIYNTNQGVLGDREMNIGDVNIFVNGGNSQPGCAIGDSPLTNYAVAPLPLKGMYSSFMHIITWKTASQNGFS